MNICKEKEKIRFFYEEGAKLWKAAPERVISREFYELWEEVQQPKPFILPEGPLKILDQTFELPEDESGKIGYFQWDCDEACPSLVIEGENTVQKLLFSFDDGAPMIQETDPIFLENTDLSFGERLDLIYDVIAYTKKNFPARDVLSMTKKEFIESLDGISGDHDPDAISAMRRSSAHFIKFMLKNAAEDMATDELSDQLSLALGGNYSATGGIDTQAEGKQTPTGQKNMEIEIPRRSRWAIQNDLEFLSLATWKSFETEKEFVLSLEGLRVLKLDKHEAVIELPAKPSMPLSEGDILNVFERGVSEKAGTFKIDLFDGWRVYGRLRMDGINEENNFGKRLFARPVKSARSLLAAAFDVLMDDYKKEYFSRNKTVVNFLLGMEPFKYVQGICEGAPEKLDYSQKLAWSTATNPENRIVLIQGPPGTGKTCVMESVLRTLCEKGLRILVTAPSNTALDNICRRAEGLPVLRFGAFADAIAPDILERYWINENKNIKKFTVLRDEFKGGGIYAGTHVGLIKNSLIDKDVAQNGLFDVILFDEAGMSRMEEFVLCARFAGKAVLFGDHQQLPPFPMPDQVMKTIKENYGAMNRHLHSLISVSALEWLVTERKFPIIMLQKSYRCQNPRLFRFASTLFYDATVKTSEQAEYYRLPYAERQRIYPPSTVRLYRTSKLPAELRHEKLILEGNKPGLENQLEARICANILYENLVRYPLSEITVIAPYRRQIRLLRSMLDFKRARRKKPDLNREEWERFLQTRIATVDSFQGGESDLVIISYVRSNDGGGIGFVDDPNRVNVAHTRCRREMIIVGDTECLKKYAKNNVFQRMERAIGRDGEIIDVDSQMTINL